MPAPRFPTRYRDRPFGPAERAAFNAECAALLERATELDAAQQALAVELAEVRTKLAEMRVVMWPRSSRRTSCTDTASRAAAVHRPYRPSLRTPFPCGVDTFVPQCSQCSHGTVAR